MLLKKLAALLLVVTLLFSFNNIPANAAPPSKDDTGSDVVTGPEVLISEDEAEKAFYDELPYNQEKFYKPILAKGVALKDILFPVGVDTCFYIALNEVKKLSKSNKLWNDIQLTEPMSIYDIEMNTIGYVFNIVDKNNKVVGEIVTTNSDNNAPIIYASCPSYLFDLAKNGNKLVFDRGFDFIKFSPDKQAFTSLNSGKDVSKDSIKQTKGKLSEIDKATLKKSWADVVNNALTSAQFAPMSLPSSYTIPNYVQDYSWYNICSSTSITMALDWYARYYDPQLFAPTGIYANDRPHSRKINDYIYNSPYPYYGGTGQGVDRMELAYSSYISNHSSLSFSEVNTNGVEDETTIFSTYKDFIYYHDQPAIISYFWQENGTPQAHAVCGYGYDGSYYCVRDTWTNDAILNRTLYCYYAGRDYHMFGAYAMATTWRSQTLREGSTGIDVKRLEIMLSALWYNPGTINTTFDASTKAAVIAFQSDFGLTADGVVGTNTYNKLIAAHRFSTMSRTLNQGKKGDDVAELQARLGWFGYSTGTPDGIFGTNTYNAVVSFQSAKGLTADGIVGAATYAKLIN